MSRKTKVAVVHNLTGGGAIRVLEETNKILSKYYQVEIFTPERYQVSDSSGLSKITSYLKYIYMTLPKNYRRISYDINSSKFKAVIIHHDSYLKSPTSLFDLDSKSIYILHEPPREFYEPSKYHAPLLKDKLVNFLRLPILFIDKKAVKKATHVIVNSRFSKYEVDNIYGINSKFIYPGVSPRFHPTKNIDKINQCISVGSLLPYKGHEITISAIGRLKTKPKLVIIGEGRESEKNKIYSYAIRQNVEVELYNDLSDEDLNIMYNRSKVFVNAAFREPFGLCSLEAIISGDRLVTVNECGTEELKEFFPDRVTVTNRNAEDIAKGIKFSLDKFSEQNITIPERLTWGHYVKEITKLIEND